MTTASHEPAAGHTRPLPSLGLPPGREDRRVGAVVSVLLHVLVILLVVTPFTSTAVLREMPQGAGGAGPAGGGGGGHGGTGGQAREARELLRYVAVAPAPRPQAPVVAPPVPRPRPQVAPPPKPVLQPEPEKVAEPVAPPAPAKAADVSQVAGVGGGSGHDGTAGSGPGKGGGVGSGVGTGRGSGSGPGTGGGTQANYPPQPIEMFLPPYPIPSDVKGFHLIAEFDVDSTGRVLTMQFTPTPNRGYNRRLEDVFRSFKFRPGTTPDGTPLHMKAQIVVDLY
ncbi:MAG TPA: hypothetical protein VG818_14180 [Gemmatimonadaceae bacterium]|nr:hypothetical protein [Gemmatimonadaceae bacterium]